MELVAWGLLLLPSVPQDDCTAQLAAVQSVAEAVAEVAASILPHTSISFWCFWQHEQIIHGRRDAASPPCCQRGGVQGSESAAHHLAIEFKGGVPLTDALPHAPTHRQTARKENFKIAGLLG
jgi:hypothetical protein